jgi:ABC-2 type transport system ATP-binding protein
MDKQNKSPILETNNLTKYYGKARGVEDVNLSVSRGEVFGFIGPNGAGKSTTIRLILGLLFPDGGEVRLFGENARTGGAELRRKIGFVPSELNFYPKLKTGQLLNYAAQLYGLPGRKVSGQRSKGTNLIYEYAERLKLDLERSLDDLSLGNRKKAAIIQALIHRPELLILDEPTSGLDPLMQSRFYEILNEESDRGTTIFFSSHTLSEVERLCEKVAIIREGKIIEVSGLDRLRQINMKRFKITFSGDKLLTKTEIQGLLPHASDITVTGDRVQGLYRGPVQKLLKTLSALSLDDVVLENPGLEEIFMHYYREDKS